jgi:hypothetical protein
MPPRAKKSKAGITQTKSDVMAELNMQFRLALQAPLASRDPDIQAAAAAINARADLALANPLAVYTEALSMCADGDIEKIINASSGTNNISKYDLVARTTLKNYYDTAQNKDLVTNSVRHACNYLAHILVIGAFASDGGIVSWSGENGMHTVQSVSNAVLKEKCRRAGAAAAGAAGDAAM